MNDNTVTFTGTLPTLGAGARIHSVGESMDVAGQTDRGRQRAINEDSFLIGEMKRSMRLMSSSLDAPDGQTLSAAVQGEVLAVADGIGGGQAGDLASDVALRVVAGYMTNAMEWCMDDDDEERVRSEFESAFRRCQRRIGREAERLGFGRKSAGTTLTLAYIAWPQLYLAHAGDSCAFLYRNHELSRLTSPHTLAHRLSKRENLHPDSPIAKRFENVLVNAVGGGNDEIEVEFRCMELYRGDALLLCTDGLLAHVDEDEILASLKRTDDSEECCRELIELANRRGGRDNITVVMARTDKNHLATAGARESSHAPSAKVSSRRRAMVAAS